MKKLMNNNWFRCLSVLIVALLFFTDARAQVNDQNTEQQVNQPQRFRDADTDNDGFVSQKEFRLDNFAEMDVDQDGKLSRDEYRQMNKNMVGAVNQGRKKGNQKANCQATCQGNQKGKGMSQGNQQGKGNGVCPNNKSTMKNSGTQRKGTGGGKF